MGIRYEVEGDFERFESALNRLARFDFRSVNAEIGEALVSFTRKRFKDEVSPSGEPWEPSIRARTEGGKTLTDKRILANSIHAKAEFEGVVVGTNDKRARVHQEGLTIKAKRAKALRFKVGDRWATKKAVKMPERPFLGLSDDDTENIERIVRERIEEALS